MNTFIAWLSVVFGGWLLYTGYSEPSWPVGFAQAGKTFLIGIGPALLLYHAMKLSGQERASSDVANTSFIVFRIVGYVGILIFCTTFVDIVFGVISGRILSLSGVITLNILLLPLVVVWFPLNIKEGWWPGSSS